MEGGGEGRIGGESDRGGAEEGADRVGVRMTGGGGRRRDGRTREERGEARRARGSVGSAFVASAPAERTVFGK